MTDEYPVGGEAPAMPATGIAGMLARRRQEIIEAQILKDPVPRWNNPELEVWYRPVEHNKLRSTFEKLNKLKGDRKYTAEVDANADILIEYCIGVYAIIGGEPVGCGDGGEVTRFDPDLAISLGLGEDVRARDVLRGVYLTAGDILEAAQRLGEFSGYRLGQANEDLRGES